MNFKYKNLFNTEAGLVSGNLYKLPNRSFLPKSIYLTAIQGENLDIVGCNFSTIKAGGIGFSMEHSIESSFGEFCERYCSGMINKKKAKIGSYNKLINLGFKVLHPLNINIFSDWQYMIPNFPFKKLTCDDDIGWIECFDYFTDENIFIPSFLVYFGNTHNDNKYNLQTSTGLACGDNFNSALSSAMLENFERHAFADFWYNQKEIQFIKYSKNQIQNYFLENTKIQKLFSNDKMHIVVFDLTRHSCVETIVTFMYFRFKEKYYQTLGTASRFSKEDAIIKATLECYQGVEYAISLDQDNICENISEYEHFKINNYEKHFAFYNKFPHLREKVPILNEAMIDDNYSDGIIYEDGKLKSSGKKELETLNILNVYYVDITTCDIEDTGNRVVRVIMPNFSLLSGNHNFPFLGNVVVRNNQPFTEYPHPYP